MVKAKKAGETSWVRRKRLPDSRLAELLDIATSVFLREGYRAASLNEIARLASASKPTLYARFPSKEALFLAVIERRMQSISEQITLFSATASVEETLRSFGQNLLKLGLSSDQIALVRMISMEAERYPDLARQYYESGPKRGEEALARYLVEQIRLKHLKKGDAFLMARQFISLITGNPVRWFVLGFEPVPPTPAALKVHVESAIQLFLSGYKNVKK